MIAEVIGVHRLEKSARFTPTERTEWWTCHGCDWESEEFDLDDSEVGREIERVKRSHVGEAVAAAFGGLTRESHSYSHYEHKPVIGGQSSRYVGERTKQRWVGAWTDALLRERPDAVTDKRGNPMLIPAARVVGGGDPNA